MDFAFLYAGSFIGLTAVAVAAAVIAVRRDGRGTSDLVKQILLFISIATLMPLVSYAGASLVHPHARLTELQRQSSRSREETYDTKDPTSRASSRDQGESLTHQIDAETRAFNRAMFWVSFPVGTAALLAGFLTRRALAVGTALALGGLITLTEGAYSYWDDMGDIVRFLSLVLILLILLAIGLAKYNTPRPASGVP